jgi:hypothetical protein
MQELIMAPPSPPARAAPVQQERVQKAKCKGKGQRQGKSLTDAYKQIIHNFEKTKPANISIINVARDYNIQHRRVYDLFNLLASLGVCQNIERGKLAWIGLDCFKTTIAKAYAKIEIDSLTTPISRLFCLGPSPSLGQIATHFVSMYLFFGIDTLLLKQVSSVFHDPRADIKSLERRMYLVLSFLDIMGIVTHTMKTNEYKLMLDLSEAQEYALQQKKKFEKARCPLSLENLLNSSDGPYVSDIRTQRLLECPAVRC